MWSRTGCLHGERAKRGLFSETVVRGWKFLLASFGTSVVPVQDCVNHYFVSLFAKEWPGHRPVSAGPDVVAGTYTARRVSPKNCLKQFPRAPGGFLQVYSENRWTILQKKRETHVDLSGTDFPLPLLRRSISGFPRICSSPVMAVLATVPGRSRIREEVWNSAIKWRRNEPTGKPVLRPGSGGSDPWRTSVAGMRGKRPASFGREPALILAALAVKGKIKPGYTLLCSGDMRTYAASRTWRRYHKQQEQEYEKFQLSKETKNKIKRLFGLLAAAVIFSLSTSGGKRESNGKQPLYR